MRQCIEAANDDCADGCNLRGAKLVCGEDGITYQGACIAECQGVKILRQTPCNSRDPRNYDTRLLAGGGAGRPDGAATASTEDAWPGLRAGKITNADINR